MLGEALAAIQSAKARVLQLEEKMENLRLWGEDNLHPFVLQKQLSEIEKEIANYKQQIEDWEYAWQELIDGETKDLEDGAEEESFQTSFDELCEIPGVNTPKGLEYLS